MGAKYIHLSKREEVEESEREREQSVDRLLDTIMKIEKRKRMEEIHTKLFFFYHLVSKYDTDIHMTI